MSSPRGLRVSEAAKASRQGLGLLVVRVSLLGHPGDADPVLIVLESMQDLQHPKCASKNTCLQDVSVALACRVRGDLGFHRPDSSPRAWVGQETPRLLGRCPSQSKGHDGLSNNNGDADDDETLARLVERSPS